MKSYFFLFQNYNGREELSSSSRYIPEIHPSSALLFMLASDPYHWQFPIASTYSNEPPLPVDEAQS